MLVTRRGEWPTHVEAKAELYVVLKGEVVHITDTEHVVKAGKAILLASRSTWISHPNGSGRPSPDVR